MNFLKFLLLFLLVVLWAACSKDNEEIVPVSYTTLIYMAADNSLDIDVDYTLEQLREGARSCVGTPVVYLDRNDEAPQLFKLSTDGEEIPLMTYEEENSASITTLLRVMNETKLLVPSEHFGLVLWTHSMGWLPSGYSHAIFSLQEERKQTFPRTRYIGVDNHPGEGASSSQVMEITNMAMQIPASTADFILFDVCLMGGVEALYELRHICNYIIASPCEVLAESDYDASGMPYDEVLPLLFGGKEDLKKVCRKYYNHYNEKSGLLKSATITLVDARELDNLYNVTSKILKGKLSQVSTLDVRDFQIYHTESVPHVFFDFGDLIKQVSTPVEYTTLETQIDKTVLYKAATAKFVDVPIDPDHFSGLSVYVPLSKWKENKEYEYYFTMEWSSVY